MGERAKRSDERARGAEGSRWTGLLTASAPFAIRHTVERLRHFRSSPGDRELDTGGATLTLAFGGQALLVRIDGEGSDRASDRPDGVHPPHLRVALDADAPLTENGRNAALLRLRRHLGLDDDVAGLIARAADDEVRGWLERIHGVGRWTSEYVLLRGLGRFELTPWTDTGLLPAISRVYTGGFAISRGDARALAERYGWLQGLWAHTLKVAAFGATSDY